MSFHILVHSLKNFFVRYCCCSVGQVTNSG